MQGETASLSDALGRAGNQYSNRNYNSRDYARLGTLGELAFSFLVVFGDTSDQRDSRLQVLIFSVEAAAALA